MIKKVFYAILTLAKKYLEELMRGWLRRKLRTTIIYTVIGILVLMIVLILATIV